MPSSASKQRVTKTEWPHIVLNADGTAVNGDSGLKVYMVAVDHVRQRLQLHQLLKAYPDIPPAHIFAALAYYYDHKRSMDEEIARGELEVEQLRLAHPNSPTRDLLLGRQQAGITVKHSESAGP